MNKKRYSFKNSSKFQAAAAIATAAFLSACAGTPAPCVEPAVAPQPEQAPAATETTPAEVPTSQAESQKVSKPIAEEKIVEKEIEKAEPLTGKQDSVAISTNCNCPCENADSTANLAVLQPEEQSKPGDSKPEPSKVDSSRTEASKADSSKVEEQVTPILPTPNPAEDSSAAKPPEETAIKQDTILPPDPYQQFPVLANKVFAYADTLYKQGLVDSAVTYLQRFRIIKPLWSQWENTTDSLLQEFGKTNAELAKQYEPLVLQITNMNRVQTAYSIVAETADSLISLAPGDSLTRFANEQKQIAYSNTLKRAQKEMVTIKNMADQRAQFEEAEQRALDFQMRHRDFENELQIQALIDYIRELAQAAGSEASKYWDKHDPAKAMEEAIALIQAKKFSQAKELLTKLKASTLRKEAMEKYVELADAFCNAQRKETSQIFAKAQKQKNAEKKKDLLQSAIAPLDKCLSEYPESTLIQKVQDNKKFLEKELEK